MPASTLENVTGIGFWLFIIIVAVRIIRRDLTRTSGLSEEKVNKNRTVFASFGVGFISFLIFLWLLPRPDIFSIDGGIFVLIAYPMQIGLLPFVLGIVIGLLFYLLSKLFLKK